MGSFRFKEEFADNKNVRFPSVYLAKEDVLIMSFEEGQVLTNILNGARYLSISIYIYLYLCVFFLIRNETLEKKKRIAKIGLNVFLDMIKSNFIHGTNFGCCLMFVCLCVCCLCAVCLFVVCISCFSIKQKY